MDDSRKMLPFEAQRLYSIPSVAFGDARLTSGGQSGVCADLLGRPSPLTPVDFVANIPSPYNYVVPPPPWGMPPAYLGHHSQQKQSSGHPIYHQQRIGVNLTSGTSGIYSDPLTSFYGVSSRNLWGACFPNHLDQAFVANYWLQQRQHELSHQFTHLHPPRCDVDDCRRRSRRDFRPKSTGTNGAEEEEDWEVEGGHAETNKRNKSRGSLSRPNKTNKSSNHLKHRHHHFRQNIKVDDDDDVAIVGVEMSNSTAKLVADDHVRLVSSVTSPTSANRFSASPDTTMVTSSSISSRPTDDVTMTSSDLEEVKSEICLDDTRSGLHLHPRLPSTSSRKEPKAAPSHFQNNSKNSFGSFRISELISNTASFPVVKQESRLDCDKPDKFPLSPSDLKSSDLNFPDNSEISWFNPQLEVTDYSQKCRPGREFSVKREDHVTTATSSSSSSSSSWLSTAIDIKIEEMNISPRDSNQYLQSSLISGFEKNLGALQKSQKLSLETPDSISCVSLSCHLGEYRVSHQKSTQRLGKVHAPTYLPEIGQPEAFSTTLANSIGTGLSHVVPTSSRSSSSGRQSVALTSPSFICSNDPGSQLIKEEISSTMKSESTTSSNHHDGQRLSSESIDFQGGSPLCCLQGDGGNEGCTDFMCSSPINVKQLTWFGYDSSRETCQHTSSGSSTCLPCRPARLPGHCTKSFSTVNSPCVPVGVAKALQRSCNSLECWRVSSSTCPGDALSSTAKTETLMLSVADSKLPSDANSVLLLPGDLCSFHNQPFSEPTASTGSQQPAPHSHCSVHVFKGNCLHRLENDFPHPHETEINGSTVSESSDKEFLMPLPLDLTKNKTCSDVDKLSYSEPLSSPVPVSSSKFCLCCCSCCCLFRTRLLSNACSHIFSSPSSSLSHSASFSPSHHSPSCNKIVESRASSPIDWSAVENEKILKDSETQTEHEDFVRPPSSDHQFLQNQSSGLSHHSFLTSSSSTASYLDVDQMLPSVDGGDEIVDSSGLSMLSSVALSSAHFSSTPNLCGRISILDIPVSMFMDCPKSSSIWTPSEDLPPSPDLSMNYNVPSVNLFFPSLSSSENGCDGKQGQPVSSLGEGFEMLEAPGVSGDSFDNEMFLRQKIEEVKTLYQQSKREVAKLVKLSSQKARNKKRKDHQLTVFPTACSIFASQPSTTQASCKPRHRTTSSKSDTFSMSVNVNSLQSRPWSDSVAISSLDSSLKDKQTLSVSSMLTAPTLTSASLDPVQVKVGGSEEPPMLSFSGSVHSCEEGRDVAKTEVKIEKENSGDNGEDSFQLVQQPKHWKKKERKGISVSDVRGEETESSDPEQGWLFRRRSERIFLHQPLEVTRTQNANEGLLSNGNSLENKEQPIGESDLNLNVAKDIPFSPVSLTSTPMVEDDDNNNSLAKDDYEPQSTDSTASFNSPRNAFSISKALDSCLVPSETSPLKVERNGNFDLISVRKEDLEDGLKVLYLREHCFVEATIKNISPPDIYGVVVDRDRSRRPDILSLEELLSKIVNVVQPTKHEQIPSGTRVCVLWSGRSNSFYPGTIIEYEEDDETQKIQKDDCLDVNEKKLSIEDLEMDTQVNIDFDDGDTGWFPLEQIRLLPVDFPIQKVGMNLDSVLAASRKKRSSSSQAEFSTPQKLPKKQSSGDVSTSKAQMSEECSPKEKTSKEESKTQKTKLKDGQCRMLTEKSSNHIKEKSKNHLFNNLHEKISKMIKNNVRFGEKDIKFQNYENRKDSFLKKKLVGDDLLEVKSRRVMKSSSRFDLGKKTQRNSHFQNIFEEMKKFEQGDGKQLKSCKNSSFPANSTKNQVNVTIRCELNDTETFSSKTNLFNNSIIQYEKHRGRPKNTSKKVSKNVSVSPGNEDCKGTSTSSQKKRKTSISSCSESGEKHNKLPKVLSHCGSSTNSTVSLIGTALTTTPAALDSISSPVKCSRSLSADNEKCEDTPEILLWQWHGAGLKKHGNKAKSRKTFYRSIIRGNEIVEVGNSVVFLSNGKSKFKFVGCVESFWENQDGTKSVKVKWYYHPEETRGGASQIQFTWRALFQSSHEDENDLQTISHKCQILSFKDFKNLLNTAASDNNDDRHNICDDSQVKKSTTVASSPFTPPVPTASPSFSITPFTSNLSTLKQNNSMRTSYLMGSSATSISSGLLSTQGSWNLPCEVYYLAGTYEPTRNYIWFEPGVPLLKDRDRFLNTSSTSTISLPVHPVTSSAALTDDNNT